MTLARLAALYAMAGCADGASGPNCTVVGCGPAFDLKTPLDGLGLEQLWRATATVCRNARCSSGMFTSDTTPSASTGSNLLLPDFGAQKLDPSMALPVSVTLWGSTQSDRFALEVTWFPENFQDAKDGDKFSIELMDAGGSLFSTEQTVEHYMTDDPNGKVCGSCKSFRIDRTAYAAP